LLAAKPASRLERGLAEHTYRCARPRSTLVPLQPNKVERDSGCKGPHLTTSPWRGGTPGGPGVGGSQSRLEARLFFFCGLVGGGAPEGGEQRTSGHARARSLHGAFKRDRYGAPSRPPEGASAPSKLRPRGRIAGLELLKP
jgi:hypothetical protein